MHRTRGGDLRRRQRCNLLGTVETSISFEANAATWLRLQGFRLLGVSAPAMASVDSPGWGSRADCREYLGRSRRSARSAVLKAAICVELKLAICADVKASTCSPEHGIDLRGGQACYRLRAQGGNLVRGESGDAVAGQGLGFHRTHDADLRRGQGCRPDPRSGPSIWLDFSAATWPVVKAAAWSVVSAAIIVGGQSRHAAFTLIAAMSAVENVARSSVARAATCVELRAPICAEVRTST